jgi:hypothetical protein
MRSPLYRTVERSGTPLPDRDARHRYAERPGNLNEWGERHVDFAGFNFLHVPPVNPCFVRSLFKL